MACSEGMETRSVLTLPGATLNHLVLYLERDAPSGNDWKGLAGCVGFNATHITRIAASRSSQSATCTMLTTWDRSGRSSVEKLIIALRYEGREDCLRVLQREPHLKGNGSIYLVEVFGSKEVCVFQEWISRSCTP